jgi:hypothetical protein
MLDLIIAVVIGPKPAVQAVPDAGTALSLLTMAFGVIACIRAKLH